MAVQLLESDNKYQVRVGEIPTLTVRTPHGTNLDNVGTFAEHEEGLKIYNETIQNIKTEMKNGTFGNRGSRTA